MRNILFIINNILLRFKRNRKIKLKDITKINVGCGMTVQQGWSNIDGSLNALVSKLPKFIILIAYSLTGARKSFTKSEYFEILSNNIFVHHDLRYGLPFNESKVSHIYTSHFLEHLYPEQANLLLRDAYKVLQKEGVIRISVPDLEYAISLYPHNKVDMLKKYFFINDESNTFSNHKYMYDFNSLSSLLYEIGFQKVVKGEYCSGDFPDIDSLDNRGTDSLFVEATK